MKNKNLTGTGVALVTPFTAEKNIDVEALQNLVNHQINNGVDYLVVLGTTSEAATMTPQEKELVCQTIIQANNQRLPLVLGVGGNNTQSVIEQLQHTDLSPYQAILSVSPYYNKPSQEGIYQHFKAIAQASSLPILLYNVPSRTGSNMEAKTTLRLAHDFENIIGIKEASGNLVQIMQILQQKPEDFLVISGDDATALPTVFMGGDGVISVFGQALAQPFSQMIRLGLNGKITEANQLQYKMLEGFDLIFKEGNPVGIKALLHLMKITHSNAVRLPLVAATEQLKSALQNFLNHF